MVVLRRYHLFQVQKGRSQFGIGNLAVSAARWKVVDYTHFTYIYPISLLTRKPRPAEPFLKILDPLTPGSWMSFLVSSFLVTAGTVLIIKINPFLKEDKKVSTVPVRSKSEFEIL